MLLRHFVNSGGKPQITRIQSNTLTSSTANTAHYAIVVAGPKSTVVGFKVTIYSAFGTGAEMSVNSVDYVLNDTFSVTLDAVTGLSTLDQYLKMDNTSGYRLSVQITIETVSKGVIGNPSFQDNTLTV